MFNKAIYNTPYHDVDLSQYTFLVTGGAGFIGSNIVEYLLRYNAKKVRVLDNLSNGYFENVEDFIELPNFEFIEGDITNYDDCENAVEGIDFITHQAALGSVPRSIENPIATNEANINGFLNMLVAAKESPTLKQFVYAASSSTYGDSVALPKVEGKEGKPISPYAVTKLVNELYADVFSRTYGFHAIGLRYFNIFGPKQNPNNPYAAVIPIFCKHFIHGTTPTVNGDGETSRDFTFVENAVQANIKALLNKIQKLKSSDAQTLNGISEKHEVYNVACGDQITLNEMLDILGEFSGQKLKAKYGPERQGDVKHSRAKVTKLEMFCEYKPKFFFRDGLKVVYEWYKQNEMKNV